MDFKPKLVAFDLDGTLAESKQRLSTEMGNLLSQLMEKTAVAIISGAGLPQFEIQILPSLPQEAKLGHLYLFPTNAAQCYIFKNGTWQKRYDMSFSKDERINIQSALQKSLDEVGLGQDPAQVWGSRIEDRGAQISFSPLGQQAPVDAKKEWNLQHNDQQKHLWQVLSTRLVGFSVAMGGLTTIDITQKDVNKAYGLRQLAGISSISVSEMLYVGDALNEGGNDAVVIPTGVKTHQVFGPEETSKLIKEIITE